jgi:hypothetical protein
MDAITQAFSSLNSSGALKDVGQVAGIGSTAYNMYNQYQNQQYQNQLRSYAQDPAKMNAYAAQFTQPLTAGLQTGVANAAQADLATRGLTDSPEISQQVYAQAIAPYIQQNQQNGYQNALQALQVGGGAVNPNTQSANTISALAKMFAGGTPAQTPGSLPGLQNLLRTMGTQAPQLGGVGAPSDPAPTNPIDTSSWDTGSFDMSAFPTGAPDVGYTPDYLSSAGGGDYAYNFGG